MNLEGKTAMVTGGAHRVGRAIALKLADAGADVIVHYRRSATAAERTAAEIESRGVRSWTISADVSEAAEIEGLFSAIRGLSGRLDVLVNSAASFEAAAFDDIDHEAWDRVQRVNLRAPFLCSRLAARRMKASKRPANESAAIVNISDLSGVVAWSGRAHHAVSKAGLIHLTEVAARELGPAVRVNAIVPGAVLPPPGVSEGSEAWHAIGERLPVGCTGDPAEVGRAVVFLAESDFITGVTLPVDGGEHLLGAGHR